MSEYADTIEQFERPNDKLFDVEEEDNEIEEDDIQIYAQLTPPTQKQNRVDEDETPTQKQIKDAENKQVDNNIEEDESNKQNYEDEPCQSEIIFRESSSEEEEELENTIKNIIDENKIHIFEESNIDAFEEKIKKLTLEERKNVDEEKTKKIDKFEDEMDILIKHVKKIISNMEEDRDLLKEERDYYKMGKEEYKKKDKLLEEDEKTLEDEKKVFEEERRKFEEERRKFENEVFNLKKRKRDTQNYLECDEKRINNEEEKYKKFKIDIYNNENDIIKSSYIKINFNVLASGFDENPFKYEDCYNPNKKITHVVVPNCREFKKCLNGIKLVRSIKVLFGIMDGSLLVYEDYFNNFEDRYIIEDYSKKEIQIPLEFFFGSEWNLSNFEKNDIKSRKNVKKLKENWSKIIEGFGGQIKSRAGIDRLIFIPNEFDSFGKLIQPKDGYINESGYFDIVQELIENKN